MNKNFFQIRDDLQDTIALVAFLQNVFVSLDTGMNDQSKSGLFLFMTDILDRLNAINDFLSNEKSENLGCVPPSCSGSMKAVR
jgi:hypothetical protein